MLFRSVQPLTAAQVGNAFLTAQALQDNADILFREELAPGLASDLTDGFLHRACSSRLGPIFTPFSR